MIKEVIPKKKASPPIGKRVNSTTIGYIDALNDDGYWTVNATMYTIKDIQPYVVQLARDAELRSNADVLFKLIYREL